MYSLLNVIKFGLKQLTSRNDKMSVDHSGLDRSLRLDFMSGIYFRVLENLVLEENNPARFKLEIRVNHGSILDPDHL